MKKYQIKLTDGTIDTIDLDSLTEAENFADEFYGSENIQYVRELY